MPAARVHVHVKGLVQGVFFRFETSRVAKQNRVCGWVKNLRDGSVEAVFEGEKEDVERVVAFCRKGPPGAVVSDVEVSWEPWRGQFKNFRITY